MQNEFQICKKVAEIYAGQDWHKLSSKEAELVRMLEEGGYLTPNNPFNGFVGKPSSMYLSR